MINMNMNDYYLFRKEIRKLYDNDTEYGDLCGMLLEIKDKNRSIVSMHISIQTYLIEVEFDDDTTEEIKGKIEDKITDRIRSYIEKNKNIIDIDINKRKEFDKYINTYPALFCDIIVVGNSLKINL